MISQHGTETVSDVSKSLQVFSAVDYTIFFMMLLLCALIGIYFGLIKSGKNKTASDYLMGGRSMSVFPISLSLIASYISGITLLGFPTEVYIYGNQYAYSMGGLILMGFLMCHLYLPTLHDLQLTSSYEYLSLRFDNRVRLFGSISFCISIMNWLPLVVYVPALAFNQVTGVNVHIITPFVSLVCVFYTSLGGLKAVVWTDVLQTFSMFGAMMLVCIKGTIDVGGIGEVIRRNMDTGRIEIPDVRLDPTVRHSIWGLVLGASLYYLQSNAISQAMIQRYMALPTLKKAKRAVWYFVLGTLMLTIFCTYSGFLIFATFYKCDPLTTKLAKAKDQLLPLLVMETLGNYPGLPGLFVAGVFSAALSSMSTGMNSMSAVVLEDFYKTLINNEPSERMTNIIMRSVVVIVGIICVILVYVVERLGQVLQLAMSLSAITNGPSMGVFTMGLFFPWINASGAFWGGLTGLAAMTWLIIGTQNAIATGSLKFQPKPVTISGCKYIFSAINKTKSINNLEDTIVTVVNVTNSIGLESYQPSSPTLPIPEAIGDEVFLPFRLSYLWYTLIGMVVSISTAAVISYVTNKLNGNLKVKPVQANLLSPIVRRYYQRNKSSLATTTDNKAKHLDVKMNARKLSSTYSGAN